MRYSPASLAGSVSQAPSGAATMGSRPVDPCSAELRLSWRETETYRQTGGRCTLFRRPCVRAVAEPAVKIWPAGQVCLSLENRESTAIDMSVSIRHSGSDWSKEWEFDLPAKDDVFSFSGRFGPLASNRCGDYNLPSARPTSPCSAAPSAQDAHSFSAGSSATCSPAHNHQKNPRAGTSFEAASMSSSAVLSVSAASAALACSVG